MRFRKPLLRVKSVNFDFSAKSSSTDYDESNEPNLKYLAHIGSEKLLVELGVPKNELFHFFHIFHSIEKFYFSPWAMVTAESSITDYNVSNKPNSKS